MNMNDLNGLTAQDGNSLPFVSVVMPAHNEEKYISDCIQSLMKQDYPADRFEIIVVDNNSTDRTAEIAQSYGATVLLKERGPVGAVRNEGVKHSKGDIVAFIDSDCVAPSNWIKSGVDALESHPKTAFGGGCYLRTNPFPIEKFWLLSNNGEGTLPKHLIGATIFLRKADFIKAGMFSETITSGEDTKLTEALKNAGINVLFLNSISVAHLGNPITTKDFFKRQIWHSENYFRNLNDSLVDPVFYVVLAFYTLVLGSLLSAAILNAKLALSMSAIAALIPLILSAKRVLRAKYKLSGPKDLLYIYWLDLIYVIARCAGLTKSAFSKL